MRYFVTVNDRVIEVDLGGDSITVDGVPVHAEMAVVPGTPLHHLLIDGRSFALLARPVEGEGKWEISLGAERLALDVTDERTRAIREIAGGEVETIVRSVTAPMPGLVLRVEVGVGDEVRAGQGVVIIEAMKMENELKAPGDGIVERVLVEPGQTVDRGAVLLVLG